VREFFMKTGDYLATPVAQQGYISTNYTFVARDMAVQGMNVIAQAWPRAGEGDALRLSLSSNPDVVFEVVERYAEAGQAAAVPSAWSTGRCPSCPTAPVAPDFFDMVVDDPAARTRCSRRPTTR
jgi:hypothetical protein